MLHLDSHTRKPGKRADYVLRYCHDLPIAIVEAKAEYKNPGDELQQARGEIYVQRLLPAKKTNLATYVSLGN